MKISNIQIVDNLKFAVWQFDGTPDVITLTVLHDDKTILELTTFEDGVQCEICYDRFTLIPSKYSMIEKLAGYIIMQDDPKKEVEKLSNSFLTYIVNNNMSKYVQLHKGGTFWRKTENNTEYFSRYN